MIKWTYIAFGTPLAENIHTQKALSLMNKNDTNHVFYIREKGLGGQEPTDIKTSIHLQTQDYTLNISCQGKVIMKVIRFFILTL